MFERPEADPRHESEPEDSLVRIDATVFETFSLPTPGESPRIERWLATWASGDR